MNDDPARKPSALRRLKAALPAPARNWITARRSLRTRFIETPLTRMIDAWAIRRSLDAVIVRTNQLRDVQWLGHPIWQFPMDAWVLQEVISTLKPGLIVETGTHRGGSAYYFATLLDLLDIPGKVISIDIAAEQEIAHPRITYLSGSSTDPAIVSQVREQAAGAGPVLVILDSDHRAAHVGQELDAYAPIVPVGSLLHIQDGWVDKLKAGRAFGSGPTVAAKEFLAANPAFRRDRELEQRYLLTLHPMGWLRRIEPDPTFPRETGHPDRSPPT